MNSWKRPAAIAGILALALMAAACDNTAANIASGGRGQVNLSIGIEGIGGIGPAGPAALARTVVPDNFSLTAFTKFEADFTATSGGTTRNGVVLTGSTSNISLEVGTYSVKITAYTGSGPYTAAAEGSQAGVVVTLGGTTPVSILLGPKTGGGKGSFSYSVDVTTAIDSGSLAVKTVDGSPVDGGTKTLTGSTTNSDTISLDPGFYQVTVSLTKESQGAGLVEIIHIYTGLTSSLSASFTADDFTALVTVSDLDLSLKFAAPETAQAPKTSLNGEQYTGTIAWNPQVSETFAASTSYTATVTLEAKPGYTFTGVAANAFSYSSANSVSNELDGGVVTVVFQATIANAGTASAAYVLDDGVIGVTAEPPGLTIVKESSTDLVLTVPDGYTVTGWYIDGVIAAALGKAQSVNLDPDDYDAKAHRVSVFATKGGRPYSWTEVFTVEAGGGRRALLSLNDFITAVQNMSTNTPEAPLVLALDPAVNFTDSTTATALSNALKPANMTNKYITVDLSAYSFTAIAGGFTLTTFNTIFAKQSVVGIILPDTLISIGDYFLAGSQYVSGLRSITIPAGVTNIGSEALYHCSSLTRVTFAGNSAVLDQYAFPGNFFEVYNTATPKTGTYVYSTGSWSKE